MPSQSITIDYEPQRSQSESRGLLKVIWIVSSWKPGDLDMPPLDLARVDAWSVLAASVDQALSKMSLRHISQS